MALITCSECENRISDRALSCPHCGLPFQLSNIHTFQTPELEKGVWVDVNTALMWSRISIGQQWRDGSCHGEGTRFIYQEAKNACQYFDLAGYDDWRLPTTEELKTLLNPHQRGYNCPDKVLYQPKSDSFGAYWASTKNRGFFNSLLGFADNFDFNFGNYGGAVLENMDYVRPVRRHV